MVAALNSRYKCKHLEACLHSCAASLLKFICSCSDDQLVCFVFLWCFTSFSISQETRIQLNGTYSRSFLLNSFHYFTNWGWPFVDNVMISIKMTELGFKSANLKIQFECECFKFLPQFFLHTPAYACMYLQKLHMGNVCILVVSPLHLLQILFYISLLVTVGSLL